MTPVELSHDPVGLPVYAIGLNTMRWAVAELASASSKDWRKTVKVRSGEHLALLLLTGFLVRIPSGMDVDGGVDMVFDLDDGRFPVPVRPARQAAFEVKSLRGPFRETEARIELGESFTVACEAAASILARAADVLHEAKDSMSRKVADDVLRNVFLVVHPFDGFAVEALELIMGQTLEPSPASLDSLDSIWVLWVPDHLTVWSRSSRTWTALIFSGFNPAEEVPQSEGMSILQDLEAELIERCGLDSRSPYQFGLSEDGRP